MTALETVQKIVDESQAILANYDILQFGPKLDYVDIFPKSELERITFEAQIKELGSPVFETSTGIAYKLTTPVTTVTGILSLVRVRIFDETRLDFLGHPDYAVVDFAKARDYLLSKQNVNLIDRPDYQMIEIWDAKY